MSQEHFRPYTAVYLLLRKEGQVFFLRRANTGYRDGQYTLPAGHVEDQEFPIQTVIREAKEETGIDLTSDQVKYVHTNYRIRPDRIYVDLYFEATEWVGEPVNNELAKADDAQWFKEDALPDTVIDCVRAAIISVRNGRTYSELQQS